MSDPILKVRFYAISSIGYLGKQVFYKREECIDYDLSDEEIENEDLVDYCRIYIPEDEMIAQSHSFLIKALQDEDRFIRSAAIDALGSIRLYPNESVRALIKVLRNDQDLKTEVILSLENFQSYAEKLIPNFEDILLAAQEEQDEEILIMLEEAFK